MLFTDQMRFTGMSGLDVNDMVSQLMRAHSVRLDRMRQQRDVILWQRDALRGVASSVRTFQSNFLSFTSNQHQNIRAVGNFNALNTSVLDSDGNTVRGITVNPTDGRNAGSRTMRVESVAQGDIFRSVNTMNRPIRADSAAFGTGASGFIDAVGGVDFQVDLNGRTASISIEPNLAGLTFSNPTDFVEWLNGELRREFGSDTGGVTNEFTGNATGAGNRQHVWASIDSTGRLVFDTRAGNTVTIANGTGPNATNLASWGFNSRIGPDGNRINPSTAFNPLTQSMTEFLGRTSFNFEINGVDFAFNGSQLMVNGTSVMNVVEPANLTIRHVMDAINGSNAGVRMSYNSTSGRFSLESQTTGAAHGAIQFRDITGGFFNEIGLGSNNNARGLSRIQSASAPFFTDTNLNVPIRSSAPFNASAAAFDDGFSFQFTFNSGSGTPTTRTIAFDPADAPGIDWDNRDENSFRTVLNWMLASEFGTSGGSVNVRADFDADGHLVINAADGASVSIASGTDGTPLAAIGLTPATATTNRTNISDITMAQFMPASALYPPNAEHPDGYFAIIIGDAELRVAPNATIQTVLNEINGGDVGVRMTFSAATRQFTMESTDPNVSLNDIDFSGAFFDRLGFGESQVYMSSARVQSATDAVVYLDGQRFVRATNSFEVDGLSITLDPDMLNITEPLDITVSFERDTESVMQLIRDFVEEYNSLIRSIRELSETRRPRQSQSAGGGFYMPLTDEQRRGMSDREIELWEEQARRGILHRDDTLRTLTQDLHRAIFQDVPLSGGGTINMLHLGIRTARDLASFGELEIDEERLQWFLDNRLEDVTELFTNVSDIPQGSEPNPDRARRIAGSGIGLRIHDIITWQLSYGGGLRDRVGETTGGGPPLEGNRMNTRIAQEDGRIDNLLRNLQRREQRYFQVFGRLEAAMIQANSQMMFLEQLFWMG